MILFYNTKHFSLFPSHDPMGVRGRNSDNKLFKEKMGWEPTQPLYEGMKKTYEWINEQTKKNA